MTKRYYHGSNTRLPVGRVLNARPASVGAIDVFEAWRPRDKPTRLRAWFLAADEPGNIAKLGAVQRRYYYEVEPVGPTHRGDLSWMMRAIFAKQTGAELERLLKRLASAYWQGKAYDPKHVLWEYHTPTIRVVREVNFDPAFAAMIEERQARVERARSRRVERRVKAPERRSSSSDARFERELRRLQGVVTKKRRRS